MLYTDRFNLCMSIFGGGLAVLLNKCHMEFFMSTVLFQKIQSERTRKVKMLEVSQLILFSSILDINAERKNLT